jgi:DNA-binding NarL/FixJ family response regulator
MSGLRGKPIMEIARIIIADKHALVRQALRSLIASHRALKVVGEAEDAEEAVAVVAKLKPDLLVMGLALPKEKDLNALKEIKRRSPELKVLVVAVQDCKEHLLACFEAGADGCMLKNDGCPELLRAIATVLQGKIYLCRAVLQVLEQVIEGYGCGQER